MDGNLKLKTKNVTTLYKTTYDILCIFCMFYENLKIKFFLISNVPVILIIVQQVLNLKQFHFIQFYFGHNQVESCCENGYVIIWILHQIFMFSNKVIVSAG